MLNYEVIVERCLTRSVYGGMVLGSVTGAYMFTNPRFGDVRLRDAVFGSIVGGTIGGLTGGLTVLGYPILLISPLALGPYAYNKYKMESENSKQVKLECSSQSHS